MLKNIHSQGVNLEMLLLCPSLWTQVWEMLLCSISIAAASAFRWLGKGILWMLHLCPAFFPAKGKKPSVRPWSNLFSWPHNNNVCFSGIGHCGEIEMTPHDWRQVLEENPGVVVSITLPPRSSHGSISSLIALFQQGFNQKSANPNTWTMDSILPALNEITIYVTNRINSFLLRGADIRGIGILSWAFIEIVLWNVVHFYVISFILEKWIQLDRRQCLMAMVL